MARVDSFLRLVVEQRASDLHLRAGSAPWVRYCGELHELPFRTLSENEAYRLIGEIMAPEAFDALKSDEEFGPRLYTSGLARFRVHAFRCSTGPVALFRVIPSHIPTVEELGLPASLKRLTSHTNGLVLVTGPTGSGKSTTLAALIHEINKTSRRHVITIEDPIEFRHEPQLSLITQRQIGLHATDYVTALRSALREAPDVIVVGELRDLETVQLALTAAETGVLVFGTLHTRSSARAIDRILDVCGDDSIEHVRNTLAAVLQGVVAQRLCHHRDGDALVPAVEILLKNHAVAHMIRENKIHQLESWLATPERRAMGMQSLDACIVDLFDASMITAEEAIRSATSVDTRKRIKDMASGDAS